MSTRYIVALDGVPPSSSPISNAVIVGKQCWISGQLSVGPDSRYHPGTAREEAGRAFGHVFRIAEAAGFAHSEIVYVDLLSSTFATWPRSTCSMPICFPKGAAGPHIYQAAALPFDGRVKVQAVAAKE